MAQSGKEKATQVAVIGSGYWGKNLIRNFHNLGALKLICDKNEAALTEFKSQYAGVEICIALTDVLSWDDIAGVVISSPAETHFSIARESLLADKNVFVEKPLTLHNVSVYQGVTLEDGVFCGPSMFFTNIYNPLAEFLKMDQVRPTRVKKSATIGANATIVCGVTLGRYCFIGAGAVLNKNVADHAIVVGNPARQIGWACECGERLTEDLDCLSCGKQFEKKG